eukprot:Sspe_Gene.30822::Locus_15224_Transcript_1_1_Confidence_1.000_Length_758::g.30822::m.30822
MCCRQVGMWVISVLLVAGGVAGWSNPQFVRCNTSRSCPAGYTCGAMPVAAGAPTLCLPPPSRGTPFPCPTNPPSSCCSSSNCSSGAVCSRLPAPCGGPMPQDSNKCYADQCSEQHPCPSGQACANGVFHDSIRNLCVTAHCESDADCRDGEGGECRYFYKDGCGSVQGFFCAYRDSVCRTDKDCTGDYMICSYNTTAGAPGCVRWFPPP